MAGEEGQRAGSTEAASAEATTGWEVRREAQLVVAKVAAVAAAKAAVAMGVGEVDKKGVAETEAAAAALE